MSSEHIWLDTPLHKNKFPKIDLASIKTILMSFDGAIMSVEEACVKDLYHKNEVSLIRAGYKDMPKIDLVETEEELYNVLSYFVTF